jgi:hypothetical protein
MFGFFLYIYIKKLLIMKVNLHLLLFLFTVSFSFSQETAKKAMSIEKQFDEIYRKSNSYEAYKIIKKEYYQRLKLNTIDTLEYANNKISEKEQLLFIQKNKIEKNKLFITKTTLDLKRSLKRENSISFFGIEVTKIFYNLLLWSIILFLLIYLAFYVVKFTRNSVLTKKAQTELTGLENEFEVFRKKSLQREQKLRRQLQDEINKQRNN